MINNLENLKNKLFKTLTKKQLEYFVILFDYFDKMASVLDSTFIVPVDEFYKFIHKRSTYSSTKNDREEFLNMTDTFKELYYSYTEGDTVWSCRILNFMSEFLNENHEIVAIGIIINSDVLNIVYKNGFDEFISEIRKEIDKVYN